jgi:transposase
MRKLKKWLGSAQIILGKVGDTIARHLEPICNYFVSHTTSAVMEGIHTKIKLILRQSYGFKDFSLMPSGLSSSLLVFRR